jgi:acetate---CoA ligase (ADP-forming)
VATVRPRYLPLPYQDSPESGRLILRDGTTTTIRIAQPADREAMDRFFASLSKRANLQRFFSFGQPSAQLIESFCDNSDPRKRLSLIVTRSSNSTSRIIATGNYIARDEITAEVAMAVDDRFQGKGIGMLLLERLAVLAASNGFRRFWALTMVENQPMLQVFGNSGFELHTRSDGSYVEIDFSVVPTEASVARAEMRERGLGNVPRRVSHRHAKLR